MEKDLLICSPHDYYSVLNQDNIAKLCMRDNRQWIYSLINAGTAAHNEIVITETSEWLLCLDKHPGEDTRYLVVFRDLALKIIRDLREKDVPMLREVLASVRLQVRQKHPAWVGCLIYFHYYPSVYQLHAHVCEDHGRSPRSASCRCHHVGHVLRNLLQDNLWYAKALILTNRPKNVFRSPVRLPRVLPVRTAMRCEN
jgi:diadenosine tetraphosphate (Ap4A) HIT family hydrolase